MLDDGIFTDSLASVSKLLGGREVSAGDLCTGALERIARYDDRINAMADVIADSATAEAREIDAARARGQGLGPLAGIPVVTKEIMDTVPARCSAGLPFLADYVPREDAPVVRSLREAGAVVIGVTRTDPGAFDIRTLAVRHPQADAHIVGGSSGGSGAALAAGYAFAALGSDTGGSIRIPAACCVVGGFKPTYGRVPTAGVRPLAWSLDHVGPMARRCADIALVQPVLDPDYGSTRSSGKIRLTIGYDPAYFDDAEETVQTGFADAVRVCRDLGCELREVELPRPGDVIDFHLVNLPAEAAAYHFEAFPDLLESYPPTPRMTLELAQKQRGYEYVQAERRRAAARRAVDRALEAVDFIMLPTLPAVTPRREAEEILLGGQPVAVLLAMIRYTALFDQTGHPALSLPIRLLAPGLGVSVQIVGRRDRDADVVDFASRMEEVLDLNPDYGLAASQECPSH